MPVDVREVRPTMRAQARLATRVSDVVPSSIQELSHQAKERGAINLAEGFPDFEIDGRVVEEAVQAMRGGSNQYRWVRARGNVEDHVTQENGKQEV